MINRVRSLNSFRIIVFSVIVLVMMVAGSWMFDTDMQRFTAEGRFEPGTAFGHSLIAASGCGLLIVGVYKLLSKYYKGDDRLVRLALIGLVIATIIGVATYMAWANIGPDTVLSEYATPKSDYIRDDAFLVALMTGGLAFATACSWINRLRDHS